MRLGHIGLFVVTCCLGAALGRGAPVVPYGLNASKTSVPATLVPTALLSGPITCEQGSPPWSFSLPTGAATSALQVGGNTLLTSLDGKLPALASGRVPVDPSGVTSPVSISALPLPSGASTSALQLLGNASVASLDTKSPALVGGRVPVDGSGVTQPISAASLPLPAGAATSGLQIDSNTLLTSVEGKLPALASGRVPVDPSGVTSPVSISALPLPAGAATSALQLLGNASVASLDAKSPALVGGRVPVDGSGATQPISVASLPLPAGASTAALQSSANTLLSSLDAKSPNLVTGRVPVDPSGVTSPVSVASLPLPSGAATSALQATGNASLASLDGKNPALVSGRVPVDGSGVTQPTSGAAGSLADGASVNIGALADLSSANTLTGLLKALKGLLGGGLPSSLVGNRVDTNLGAIGGVAFGLGQAVSSSSVPVVLASDQSAVLVKGAAAAGAAASGNPVSVAGVDSGGSVRSLFTDSVGRPIPAGASNFQYVSTNTTTVHRTGAGIFRRAVIANLAASPSCITFYDNTAASGTVIGTVCPAAAAPGYSIVYDLRFSTGLTSNQTGATASGFTTVWDQ